MMRRMIFICLAFAGLMLTSCSNEVSEQNSVFAENSNAVKKEAYAKLLASIDSINSVYSQEAYDTRTLKGYLLTQAADAVGYVAGHYVGATVGGAIGSLSSNPLVTIVGWLAGKKHGAQVGAGLASAVVGIFSDLVVSTPDSTQCVVLPMNENSVSMSDSIGYYHNHAMTHIASHKSSFLDADSVLNYDLLYDYIASGLPTEGRLYCADDSTFKHEIVGFTVNNLRMAKVSKSLDDYLSNMRDVLLVDMQMDGEDVDYYLQLIREIIKTVTSTPKFSMLNYSNSLWYAIQDSDLDDETKEDTIGLVNILLSSILCWK